MHIIFPHSHAYDGGRATIKDDDRDGSTCVVEFGDGVIVFAKFSRGKGDIQLSVPEYRTAKGTIISARLWRLVQRSDGTWRSKREW